MLHICSTEYYTVIRNAVQCFTYTEQNTVILQGCAVAYLHNKYRVNSSCKMYSAAHTYSAEFRALFISLTVQCTHSVSHIHVQYIAYTVVYRRSMHHVTKYEVWSGNGNTFRTVPSPVFWPADASSSLFCFRTYSTQRLFA